jgi:hypothetical protein
MPFLDETRWNVGMLWIRNAGRVDVYFPHGRRQAVEVEVDPCDDALLVLHIEAETTYARYLFDFAKETLVLGWGGPRLIVICG